MTFGVQVMYNIVHRAASKQIMFMVILEHFSEMSVSRLAGLTAQTLVVLSNNQAGIIKIYLNTNQNAMNIMELYLYK